MRRKAAPLIPVNLIGKGRIGAAVAAWLAASPRYRLQAVIGRGTQDWPAAPLAIDTAGPAALRAHGARLLAEGEVWTVGAAALIDPGFRAALGAAARHPLRLFTPWLAGPALAPPGTGATLHIAQAAPRLGPAPGLIFEGPLAEAARRFPDHLNTATAAALTGPGIEATTIALSSTPDGGPHTIRARFAMPGQTVDTAVAFDGTGPHPVASAIIAALARRDDWLRYG
jgi:predicted dinucleotide-utilizing enzyme